MKKEDIIYSDTVSDKLTGEEEFVSGVDVKEDYHHPYIPNRYFCTNCSKGIHNTPDYEKRCKQKGCECKCLTHYVGYDGRIRPYGIIDDSDPKNQKPQSPRPKDDTIERIMTQWRSLKKSK